MLMSDLCNLLADCVSHSVPAEVDETPVGVAVEPSTASTDIDGESITILHIDAAVNPIQGADKTPALMVTFIVPMFTVFYVYDAIVGRDRSTGNIEVHDLEHTAIRAAMPR